MNSKNFQELIRNLQVFYKCPSCNTNYHFDDIKFLGKVDSHCFMQLNCHNCSLPVLATVLLSETTTKSSSAKKAQFKKASLPYMKSDLSEKERQKFAQKDAITSAEIADFHRFLSEERSF